MKNKKKIILSVVSVVLILGIVAVISGTGASISGLEIAKIAGKAFGI